MRASVSASYGCITNVLRLRGKKGGACIISYNFCGSETQLSSIVWLRIRTAYGNHLKAYLAKAGRFTSNMVHMVGKVRLTYGRRPFPQDCLGILKK